MKVFFVGLPEYVVHSERSKVKHLANPGLILRGNLRSHCDDAKSGPDSQYNAEWIKKQFVGTQVVYVSSDSESCVDQQKSDLNSSELYAESSATSAGEPKAKLLDETKSKAGGKRTGKGKGDKDKRAKGKRAKDKGKIPRSPN